MLKEHEIVLSLLRLAISGEDNGEPLLNPLLEGRTFDATEVNWAKVIDFAIEQGVLGICFEAIERFPEGQCPDMDSLMEWFGQVEYQVNDYRLHKDTIRHLAQFYTSTSAVTTNPIQLMLLKGYGLSLDYTVPEHRPTGDIDIFLFGNKEYADQMVEQKLEIPIEREYHKHSHFTFHDVSVENHEKFIDDINHKSNVKFEEILTKQLEAEKDKLIESDIPYCLLPPPTWNALFLLRHAGEHFASSGITLRHVLDSGFFFQKHSKDVDWDLVLKVFEEENMKPFYDAIATICVRDLGMETSCFNGYTHNDKLADRVLEDIFAQKEQLPMSTRGIHGLTKVKYGIQKSLRWYHNRWKYKMVYNETMWESFWTLAWNRIKN